MNELLNDYIKNKNQDLKMEEVTTKFNVSIPTVYRYLQKNGIKLNKNKKNNLDKINKIKDMRKQGLTFREIGECMGISKQRVEQILHGN